MPVQPTPAPERAHAMIEQASEEGGRPSVASLTIQDLMRDLQVKSRTTIAKMIARGDLPEADFVFERSPRWYVVTVERHLARLKGSEIQQDADEVPNAL